MNKPYPPFVIEASKLSQFMPGYIARLTLTFGIDKEIDLEALTVVEKNTIHSYILHSLHSLHCEDKVDEEDWKRIRNMIGVKTWVDAFAIVYTEGMSKNVKKYKRIFEFFSNSSS